VLYAGWIGSRCVVVQWVERRGEPNQSRVTDGMGRHGTIRWCGIRGGWLVQSDWSRDYSRSMNALCCDCGVDRGVFPRRAAGCRWDGSIPAARVGDVLATATPQDSSGFLVWPEFGLSSG
jgi:hypothetical protein